jgi:hypothetical protein
MPSPTLYMPAPLPHLASPLPYLAPPASLAAVLFTTGSSLRPARGGADTRPSIVLRDSA